ncbi:MAG: Rpn family recombination-promoting nuclease/putative transposase [Eubacteriales bacterium]|nr:Rpn family recombination-promoting nuclease/putative transposase [Eubacteriales bacterium]
MESQSYRELQPCINISLLNSPFPYTDKIHSIYHLLETQYYSPLTDAIALHFLDLTKLRRDNLTPLEKWLLFIKTSDKEVRNMLANENPAMKHANQTATKFYTNKEERRFYEAAERYRHDRATLLDEGFQEGKAEGIAEGLATGKAEGLSEGKKLQSLDIARKLKEDGFSIDKVIDYTGLTLDDIRNL